MNGRAEVVVLGAGLTGCLAAWELARRGHKVAMKAPWSMNMSAAIMVEAETRTLSAGADPRTSALALAW